ncbi:MAG: DNA repair protein RecN [Coriobacteriales bacterium]|jgi:DNA repair protein RecN (Recombination protein N)|nr:DNA repair protein RecN [Coriobacteriales bacterium]
MLDELTVRNYALIREARLHFAPGCTVLSGETGAGKTALIGAIKLLIGERGDTGAIREGARELRVEACFLDAAGEQVATRRLGMDGRGRCTLNDEMVTVSALAKTIGPLVDLYGQHDHQVLLAPAAQLEVLDRVAAKGATGGQELIAWQEAWDAYAEAQGVIDQIEMSAHSSEQALEQARFAVRAIEALKPEEGELEALEARLPILRNGEELATASREALALLRDEGKAMESLFRAHLLLERQRGVDARLDALVAQLGDLALGAEDSAASLRAYCDDVEFDPAALEEALDRLGQLEGLRRRFGPRMEDVFATWTDASARLDMTDNLKQRREQAVCELGRADEKLHEAARQLSDIRARAAQELSVRLTASLQNLAMEGSSLSVAIHDLPRQDWTRQGPARYEMLYRPVPSSGQRPLAKIASGGELSRVMLAIKALEHGGKGQDAAEGSQWAGEQVTLVFDEIDAGIGGATATAVAERLRALARDHQLIVVTHLAQIAAIATTHLLVEKIVDDQGTYTGIREVTGDERVAEIARMLAGSTDETALNHARQLLEDSILRQGCEPS